MITADEAARFARGFAQLAGVVDEHVRGKSEQVTLALVAMLAEGHVLIEDVPGVAKTRLAKALARAIGGTFARVQFTADLLPSDLTGVRIYRQKEQEFRFEPGPVFANVLLGDEINRASPKTQAALLEVMAEKQVTVGGQTHRVARPFVCLGTQNPVEFYGTYPLPEAQLDRFTVRLSLGYPSPSDEAAVLADNLAGRRPEDIEPPLEPRAVLELIALAREVEVRGSLRDYIVRIAGATRGDAGARHGIRLGISPRGCVALAMCAQVRAAAAARPFATDEDVQQLAVPVLAHRLVLEGAASGEPDAGRRVLERVLASIKPPTYREIDLSDALVGP